MSPINIDTQHRAPMNALAASSTILSPKIILVVTLLLAIGATIIAVLHPRVSLIRLQDRVEKMKDSWSTLRSISAGNLQTHEREMNRLLREFRQLERIISWYLEMHSRGG
ncbi:hypothetical protein BDV98DRAFT_591178 [Pterulicium gracile]|uniref:Uncharacterized protein n=1 Tax=Pterulicium gracile TaxID=1884261 RepID=A0A5C3QMU1_9AGAR|nr:hypothetical protein BDV98DRAFT_591178 [Pterula gracilis]